MADNIHNTPLHKRQCKFKGLKKEKETIFNYLQNNIATASMVSQITGISQQNICRYKSDLEKKGILFEVDKKNCKVTGYKAWYLTCNKDLLRKEAKNGK